MGNRKSKKFLDLLLNRFAAIATIIGIIIAYYGLRPEHHKELTLEFLRQVELLAIPNDELSALIIVHKESREEIAEPTLLELILTNTGRTPINGLSLSEEGDIELPVKVHIPATEVIASTISYRRPEHVTASVNSTPSGIEIGHGILNSGDSISIKIWLRHPIPKWPDTSCRIVGIQELTTIFPALPGSKTITVTVINYAAAIFMLGISAGSLILFVYGLVLLIKSLSATVNDLIKKAITEAVNDFPFAPLFYPHHSENSEDVAFNDLFRRAVDDIETLTDKSKLIDYCRSYFPPGVTIEDNLLDSLATRIQGDAKHNILHEIDKNISTALPDDTNRASVESLNIDFDIKLLRNKTSLINTLFSFINPNYQNCQRSFFARIESDVVGTIFVFLLLMLMSAYMALNFLV